MEEPVSYGQIFMFMPFWVEALIMSLSIMYLLIAGGIAISRSGRSPMWSLLLLLPIVQIAVIWAFALIKWPKEKKKRTKKAAK